MMIEARARRWPRLVAGGLALVVAGALCTWGVLTILRPAEDPLASTEHTYVEVAAGEVSASISLNAVAEWTQIPVGANQASGIVTSVGIEPGAEVSQGTVLYSVGLRPVVVAQGDVPMFRQIGSGIEGDDVRQLQEMLAALGFYGNIIDGKAEMGTTAAIKEWQGAVGVEESGVVEPGDVIFVPQLPTRLALDTELVHRGANLSGNEEAILGLSAAPEFWVPVTEGQAAMMPAGTMVEVNSPDGQIWQGVAGEQERDTESGTISVVVAGSEGATLCGDACGQIPVSGQTTLTSKIVTVEQVTGLVLPSSAIVTTADGTTAVIDRKGDRIPIQVVASAKGMSVVSGVDEGIRVRVPATAEPMG